MGTLLPNPNDVPTSQALDWVPLINRDAAGYSGMSGMQLTNWNESDLLPAIEAGSKIDIVGSIAFFDTAEVISTAGLSDGTVYLRLIVDDQNVTASLTNVAPTFSVANNGFYAEGHRYSGHAMVKSGTSYTSKHLMTQAPFQNTGPTLNSFDGPVSAPDGLATSNTVILFKKFSGTLDSNGDSTVPHGLPFSKILSMSLGISASGGAEYFTMRDTDPSVFQYDTFGSFNSTNIVINANISTFANGSYRAVIFYEA